MKPKPPKRRVVQKKPPAVIEPLRGKNTEAQREFAKAIWKARRRQGSYGHPYKELGKESFHSYMYMFEFLGFFKKLDGLFKKKQKIRMLDIGPGTAEYSLDMIDSLGDGFGEFYNPYKGRMELHTLSPEQINPKIKNKKPNPDYRSDLHHHVGAIETYDPEKLGGKFDLIISKSGGIVYSPFPLESMEKTAHLLEKGGTAYLNYLPWRAPRGVTGKLQELLGKKFGVSYRVFPDDDMGQRDRHFMIIERKV